MLGFTTMSRALRVTLLAAASLGAGACSFSPIVASQATHYNKAYGDSLNEQLLLNAVRASRDYPLNFTRLTSVTHTMTASADTGGLLGLEHGILGLTMGPKNLGLSSGLSGSVTPSFQVTPLDSKEFYQGIMTPLDPALFETFWDSGVPPGLLIHLLVDRIDVYGANGACYFRNDPLHRQTHDLFARLVGRFIAAEQDGRPFGRGGAVATGAGQNAAGEMMVASHGTASSDEAGGDGQRFRGINVRMGSASRSIFVRSKLDRLPAQRPCTEVTDYQFTDRGSGPPSVRLRSVEGVFQYLGRVIAAQRDADPPFTPTAPSRAGGPKPILKVVDERRRSAVATLFERERYAIPQGPGAGYSMRTLSTLSQLFHLSLASDTLPRANAVLLAN